ncbi:MAG: hypothetical protein QXH24_05595 [Candidatus Bathyarchaeia archaeon]
MTRATYLEDSYLRECKATVLKVIDMRKIILDQTIFYPGDGELPREEVLKIPGIVKMAKALPPKVHRLRIVEIVSVDKQANGGTHVRNLKEVGRIRLIEIEDKSRLHKCVHFALE